MSRAGILCSLLLALSLGGCGLHLRLVNASVRKPSNVAVYYSVIHGKDDPVPNLVIDNFKIFEDEKLVSAFESKQTLLNPELSSVQYTMLLMDMSGSVLESGGLEDLINAAGNFVERVGKTQQVAVYGFDGRKEIIPIMGFSASGGSVQNAIQGLHSFKSKDPSTNLNGAVVQGLRLLEKQMDRATQPLRFGTLVVFTDGSDRAKRVSREDVAKALDDLALSMNVFVVGVGTEIDFDELHSIGRNGSVLSKNPKEVTVSFEKITQKVENYTKAFYLLSYCSPARAGEHDLRIEATAKGVGSGSLTYHFNGNGFGPGCDPNTLPSFDLHRPRLNRNHESLQQR